MAEKYDIPTFGERRYEGLAELLRRADPVEDVVVAFADWESIVGLPLPERAMRDLSWWASLPRQTQSRVWLRQDRRAHADLERSRVILRHEVYERDNTLERIQSIRAHWVGYARTCLESCRVGQDDPHVELGWWEPHQVYVIHFVTDHQYKVGIARVGSARLIETRHRGDLVLETIELANQWAAKVVEFEVLQRVLPAWERPHRFSHVGGESERWSDWLEPPSLVNLVETLADDRARPGWGTTVYRSEGRSDR